MLIDIQECITKPALVTGLSAVGAYPEALDSVLEAIEAGTGDTVKNMKAVLDKCRAVGIRKIYANSETTAELLDRLETVAAR